MASLSSKILAPSIAILNRLKFSTKFSLTFILYLIPVIYVTYISLTEHQRAINNAELERQGLTYMKALRPLVEHMAQARGMTNAYQNGKKSLKSKILAKRSAIRKELKALSAVDVTLNGVLKIGSRLSSIHKDWNEVVANAFNQKAVQAFAAHTAVINKVLALKSHVLETSRLMLDPSIDSNFMANALGVRIPVLAESMGKARGLGAGIVTAGKHTPMQLLTLLGYIRDIENANNAMMHGFDVIFMNDETVQKQLSSLRKQANRATHNYVTTTKNDIIGSKKITIDAVNYFSKGTAAIEVNLKLYDAIIISLDKLLQARTGALKGEVTTNLATSFALLIVALFLFGGLYSSLMSSIRIITKSVRSMAEGDLTTRIELETKDEMQLIAQDMNWMIQRTNGLVSQVMTSADEVASSSDKSVAASDNTCEGVNKQNMQLEQVATAITEMSSTVHEVASNASSTAEATRSCDKKANEGSSLVQNTIHSMNKLSSEMQEASTVIKQLESDSERIGSVLDVIRGIADQTNLLALNAAIEAARAGEQGRGFAVVADEVRTLASRTQDSTQEIQTMIEKLQQGAQKAVKVMANGNEQAEKTVTHAVEAGSALKAITAEIDHITKMNEQIASASEEQTSVAEEINRNVINVRDISEHTVKNAKQTTESSESLKRVATQLQGFVGEFKVN